LGSLLSKVKNNNTNKEQEITISQDQDRYYWK